MKTNIQLTYCGMRGDGPTIREAKQDAARKIEAALAANYMPTMLTWRGNQILVWRTPTEAAVIAHIHDGKIGGTGHGSATMDEALQSARMSLAQLGWIETDTAMPSILGSDKQAHREFAGWVGFQLAYNDAKAKYPQDENSNAWHAYACNHAGNYRPTLA